VPLTCLCFLCFRGWHSGLLLKRMKGNKRRQGGIDFFFFKKKYHRRRHSIRRRLRGHVCEPGSHAGSAGYALQPYHIDRHHYRKTRKKSKLYDCSSRSPPCIVHGCEMPVAAHATCRPKVISTRNSGRKKMVGWMASGLCSAAWARPGRLPRKN
jgi:hypothetical protein